MERTQRIFIDLEKNNNIEEVLNNALIKYLQSKEYKARTCYQFYDSTNQQVSLAPLVHVGDFIDESTIDFDLYEDDVVIDLDIELYLCIDLVEYNEDYAIIQLNEDFEHTPHFISDYKLDVDLMEFKKFLTTKCY